MCFLLSLLFRIRVQGGFNVALPITYLCWGWCSQRNRRNTPVCADFRLSVNPTCWPLDTKTFKNAFGCCIQVCKLVVVEYSVLLL